MSRGEVVVMCRGRRLAVLGLALVLSSVIALRVVAEEEGSQAVDAAWANAMKSNSVDAVMACYASNAVCWFPGEAEAKGLTAIRATYDQLFSIHNFKDAVLSDTHFKTAGNTSIGWGKFSLTVVEKMFAKTNVWTGRFTDVAERQGGRWLLVVDHASADPMMLPIIRKK